MSDCPELYKGIGIGVAVGALIGMLVEKKKRKKRPSAMVRRFMKTAGAIVCLLGDAFGF